MNWKGFISSMLGMLLGIILLFGIIGVTLSPVHAGVDWSGKIDRIIQLLTQIEINTRK